MRKKPTRKPHGTKKIGWILGIEMEEQRKEIQLEEDRKPDTTDKISKGKGTVSVEEENDILDRKTEDGAWDECDNNIGIIEENMRTNGFF